MLRRSLTSIGRGLRSFSEAGPAPQVATTASKPVKEPIIQQWKRFWRNLYADYRDVVVDTAKDVREKPKKALFYTGMITGTCYLMETNPDERSFRTAFLQLTDDMVLVSDKNLNSESEKHLRFLSRCYNEGIVRRMSFAIFSVIWLDNYDKNCALYSAQCDYLKPGIGDFFSRIVDVGFHGTWWNLERHGQVCDINPSEFPEEPTSLFTTQLNNVVELLNKLF